MTGELPKIEQDQTTAPYAQEIEYALTLQRMINVVNQDPAQMRMAIYGLARARMDADTARLGRSERGRLLNSLETAIQGVENFSQRRDDIERLSPPSAESKIGQQRHASTAVTRVEPIDPKSRDILVPNEAYPTSEIQVVEVRSASRLPLILSTFVLLLAGAVLGLGYYHERLSRLSEPGRTFLEARRGTGCCAAHSERSSCLRSIRQHPRIPVFRSQATTVSTHSMATR